MRKKLWSLYSKALINVDCVDQEIKCSRQRLMVMFTRKQKLRTNAHEVRKRVCI